MPRNWLLTLAIETVEAAQPYLRDEGDHVSADHWSSGLGIGVVNSECELAMTELLRLLASQLVFFLDPHGYSLIPSEGSAIGDALVDLKRGDLIWRLARARGQVSSELRLDEEKDHPAYSTDILKRWLTDERDDDAALLSEDVVTWLRDHLAEIESALESRREATIEEWESLKRIRSRELSR